MTKLNILSKFIYFLKMFYITSNFPTLIKILNNFSYMKYIILSIFISLTFSSCSNQNISNNNVDKNITIDTEKIEPESKQEVKKENKFLWAWYNRESDGIYYFDDKLKNAHRDSFELLNHPIWSEYGIDNKNAYGFWKLLLWSDLASFEVLSFRYAKDKNNVYCYWETLEWVPSNTFINTDFMDTYAISEDDVYYNCDLLTGARGESIEILRWWEWMAKDGESVYCGAEKINWADSDSYSLFSITHWKRTMATQYSKDKNNVYFSCSRILEGADPDSFEIISPFFAKDKNNIYHHNKILDGVDIENYTLDGLEKMVYGN